MNSLQPPREKIPWFPTVDARRCTGCRTCVDFCPHGVYGWDAERNAAVVEKPYSCIVGCSGCLDKCAAGAIAFPEWAVIRAVIDGLRREGRGGG